LDDDDDTSLIELLKIFTGGDVRRRRVTLPFGVRVRTFTWKHMLVPMWQGMMVCLGTLTFKRYYLQSL
jgi:hypothetical protein